MSDVYIQPTFTTESDSNVLEPDSELAELTSDTNYETDLAPVIPL